MRVLALLVALLLTMPMEGWAALAKVGRIALADNGFGSTQNFSVSSGVSQGNYVVARGILAIGSGTLNSCTDSRGNVYTVDAQLADASNVVVIAMCSSYMATALQAGDTISMVFSMSSGFAGEAVAYSGTASSSVLDKTSSQVTSYGQPYSSGATASTTSADELLVGVCGVGSDTRATPGTGWTEEADVYGTNPGRSLVTGYKIVSAIGAYAFDGTYAAATSGPCLIATYKAASGGGSPVNVFRRRVQ